LISLNQWICVAAVGAVDDGMSRRAAVARSGVAPSKAIAGAKNGVMGATSLPSPMSATSDLFGSNIGRRTFSLPGREH